MANFTVAVVDMGSNSFRLLVSEVIDGAYKVVEEYKETVRIGDDVYRNGIFSYDAMQTVLNILRKMRLIMDNMKVQHVRIVGTAPFRDASNSDELLRLVKEELGLDIDIISGEEEGRLIYLAATGYFDLSELKTLFVDIGGGSTELSYTKEGELTHSISTPLGCSRITQTFIKKNKAKPEEIQKLKKHIEKTLNDVFPSGKIDKIVFTGGTVNSLAQVYIRRNTLVDSTIKYVDTTFLNHLVNELAGKSYENRAKIQGLEEGRADISLAAGVIVQYLLKHYNLNGFYAFSGGLRNGLTIDLLNKLGITMLFQDQKVPDIRYSKLIETGRKYNYEEEHSKQVTTLAHKIFKGLYKSMKLDEADWALLEAAAVLHDIGQHISYSKHHKHSYYLISNTELVGYTIREQEIIANIARYHRRSTPKNDQEPFGSLPSMDKTKICKLAAILRVADALDRSHISAVEDLEVFTDEDSIVLYLHSDKDLSMEIAGVEKKKDLLEEITDKKVILKYTL